LFWRILTPEYQEIKEGNLRDAITQYFDTFGEFKKRFSEVAENHFASGWAW
jgi:Fe-Mn family superoxide dismutase